MFFLPRYFQFRVTWALLFIMSCCTSSAILFTWVSHSYLVPPPGLSRMISRWRSSLPTGHRSTAWQNGFPTLLPRTDDLIDFHSIKCFFVIFCCCACMRILCKSFVRMSHIVCASLLCCSLCCAPNSTSIVFFIQLLPLTPRTVFFVTMISY